MTVVVPLARADEYVDWHAIEHWAGDPSGKHKAALVVDFQDGKDKRALVWGYRWNGNASGEDLVRAVASQSSVLTAMIQYTGSMGSTLNALGVSKGRKELDYLCYDFSHAVEAGEVSFGYFEPMVGMGQESVPGMETEKMCKDAIEAARISGIIEHPLNAFVYGYPAYDYDYWQLDAKQTDNADFRWRSGWYNGYWSYWHGTNDYDKVAYSGLGMSSTMLVDGCVHVWKYRVLDGSSRQDIARELNYDLTEYGEQMHEYVPMEQIVDFDRITRWIGTGEKEAAVVVGNKVLGYRWSGGYDDALDDVVKNLGNAGIKVDMSDNLYVRRKTDKEFTKVPDSRFLSCGAVLWLVSVDGDLAFDKGSLDYSDLNGLRSVETSGMESVHEEYFDLSGRRADKGRGGRILIRNGKKFWVR